MEEVWITLAIVGALALGATAAWLLREVWPWRSLTRRRVLLVIVDTTTVEGILWAKRGPLIIVKQAVVHLEPGNPGRPVDGEMVIERDRIAWMQVVGSPIGTLQ